LLDLGKLELAQSTYAGCNTAVAENAILKAVVIFPVLE